MADPTFVPIPAHSLERFEPLLGDRFPAMVEAAAKAHRDFQGRAIWHVSSTLQGGGVAEMLSALLPYVRGAGVDTRWVVLREPDEFFALTKRIHNNLHGFPGDGGELGPAERHLYEDCLADERPAFRRPWCSRRTSSSSTIRRPPGSPTAPRRPERSSSGAATSASIGPTRWHCGRRTSSIPTSPRPTPGSSPDASTSGRGSTAAAPGLMAPSIDPFSPKNQELDAAAVDAILGAIGLGARSPRGAPTFVRADGTPGRVDRDAEVIQEEPLPDGCPLVAQVSRWDRLKDPRGLLDCFEQHLSDGDQHLLLAGPSTTAVSDDPEGAAVWDDVRGAWHRLPDGVRRRVHLASLPTERQTTKTRRWSTRSSAAPTSSSRRAWPRASG